MIGANNVRLVDSFDSWLIVAVDSLTRANARKLIVLIVCCNPYVCVCAYMCARACVYTYQKLSKLSKLSTVLNDIDIKQQVTRLIVCINFNQTINQLSTKHVCVI